MRPIVTVLMCAYNEELFIRDAIESILNQQFKQFELLIILDPSTDNTEKIIDGYVQKDNRIRCIINKERLGLVKSLNRGIRLSKGEYIARFDADDISMPNRLDVQVYFMEKNKNYLLCGSGARILGTKRSISVPEGYEHIKCKLLFKNILVHPSIMFRKKMLLEYGIYYNEDYRCAEDYELWQRVAQSYPIANINKDLIHYRFHSGQLTRVKRREQSYYVNNIRKTQLRRLGIDINNKNRLKIHYEISNRNFKSNLAFIKKAEKWLLVLIEANRRKGIYPFKEFGYVINDIWVEICLNAPGSILAKYRLYINSELSIKIGKNKFAIMKFLLLSKERES